MKVKKTRGLLFYEPCRPTNRKREVKTKKFDNKDEEEDEMDKIRK